MAIKKIEIEIKDPPDMDDAVSTDPYFLEIRVWGGYKEVRDLLFRVGKTLFIREDKER